MRREVECPSCFRTAEPHCTVNGGRGCPTPPSMEEWMQVNMARLPEWVAVVLALVMVVAFALALLGWA